MQFEHLIAINDPANPLLTPLSREQVWAGLMQRVDNPLPFLPGLEACAIIERRADCVIRELDFGSARIRDRVTQAEGQWLRFDIEANEQHAGGSLTIRIEEPAPGQLFLRFAYTTGITDEDKAYGEYIKSAYRQSDIDCVRIIREMAER